MISFARGDIFFLSKKGSPRTLMEIQRQAPSSHYFGHMRPLLRYLRAVFGSSLFSIFYWGTVENASDDMVSNTGEILHASTTYENDTVLLQVMSFTANVGNDFLTCGETYPSYFSQGRVWFFRSFRFYLQANTALERTLFQSWRFAKAFLFAASISDQLVYGWHTFLLFPLVVQGAVFIHEIHSRENIP